MDINKLLSRTTLYRPNKMVKSKKVTIPQLRSKKKTTKKSSTQKSKNKVKSFKLTAGSRSGLGRLQKAGMANRKTRRG